MKRNKIIFVLLIVIFFIVLFYYYWGSTIIEFDVCDDNVHVSWYKNEDGEYYFFLPKEMSRESLSVELKFIFSSVSVDSYQENRSFIEKISMEDKCSSFQYDTFLVQAKSFFSRKREYIIHVMQSDLPSVFLDIDGGDSSFQKILSDDIWHRVSYPGNITAFGSDSSVFTNPVKKIRGRGNSTWLREKKPFQISFSKEVSLLGMKKSKKWVLLANHWDGSLSRNYLWLTLANKMGIDYSVDCVPSDLYINHHYMGSYLITNKVEASPSSIPLEDGYLFEIMNQSIHDLELEHGYQINIHYPNIKKMSLSRANQVKQDALEYLNHIESLLYDTHVSLNELDDFIDIDSFIKYYWIQELSENYDVSRGSNFLYVQDNRLHIGPVWDMDNTLNRSYYYANTREHYILNNSRLASRSLENWFQVLFQKEGFADLIDDYYKNHVELFHQLVSSFDDYQTLISQSATMNYVRWSYDKMRKEQIRPWLENDVSFHTSCILLRESLLNRLDYYDKQYANDS